MKQIQYFAASFSIILVLGGIVFLRQTQSLQELRSRSKFSGSNRAPTATQAISDELPAKASNSKKPAPVEDPATEFMNALHTRVSSSLEPELLADYMADLGYLDLVSSVAGLSKEESLVVGKELQRFETDKVRIAMDSSLTPAARESRIEALKQRKTDWLAARLGKERADAVALAEQARERSLAEQHAANAISRLASTVNLSDSQKDELTRGLIERDLQPDRALPVLEAKTFGKINLEPPAPDLSDELETLLTPDQRQLYELRQERASRKSQQEQKLMAKFTDALMPALTDLLAEP